MEKRRKRRKALGAIVSALLLALCGCGNNGVEEAPDAGKAPEDDYVYVAEYQSLNQYCEKIGSIIMGENQDVFFTGIKDEKEVLFSLKIGEDSVREFPLELEDGLQITVIGKDAEGNLLLGLMGYDGDPEAGGTISRVAVKKISSDGKELETVDTGNAFTKQDAFSFYMAGLLQDKEGNYYICTGENVYVLGQDGSLYCEISIGQYISNMFALKDGRIAVVYRGNAGYNLEEVDLSKKSTKPLETSIVFDYGTYQGGKDTDLLYTQNSVLYACNLTDEKPTSLLNWMDSDIDSNYLKGFEILSDGRIAAVTVDYSSGGETELSILTKKSRSEVPEKKILTYSSWYVPYYVEKDIVAFNKRSAEYRIEVREYGDANTGLEEKIAQMNADLTGTQPPDIIDMTYCPLSLDELIAAGIVEDIMPYFEADETIKKEDYVENALRAYERDGKLYAIMPCYGIQAIIGRESDLGTGKTWTPDDMMALVDSKGADMEVLQYVTKGSMLQMMCATNQGLFVNAENGTSDFTGEEFKKILEFANRFPNDVDYDPNAPSRIEKLRNGELLLIMETVTAVSQYQMFEYEFGEPVNIIGYPTFGESGLMLAPNSTTAAMHAASENKEGVWEFIRFNITKERQEKLGTANGGFPVLKSALDKMLEEEMEDEYYVDEDGNKKLTSKSVWTTDDFTVEVYAATQEQVDRVREMIDTAQPDIGMDQQLFAIIYEEAQAYFDGQKSAEDVAGLVQNRVQTYLNETK